MSYIRATQEGHYVPIPNGSNYYWYGNGETISGYSPGAFAAMVGSVVFELDVPDHVQSEVQSAFDDHFGGWNPDEYQTTPYRAERGEVFCQCVDTRIESLDLTDELHQEVVSWVEKHPDRPMDTERIRECEYCGSEFESDTDLSVCHDWRCEAARTADIFGYDARYERNAQQIQNELLRFDYTIDELLEHAEQYRLSEADGYNPNETDA